MTLPRFIFYLFVFISTLAGSGIFVATIMVLVRFPPLLVGVLLACWFFSRFLRKTEPRA